MPDSERSFADRMQRGRELHASSAGIVPPFAPADGQLAAQPFEDFLGQLDENNIAVAEAMADWQFTAAERSAVVAEIKARALRASSRVKSNATWKVFLPTVKTAADNLRGYSIPKPKPPADAPPSPVRQKGDQSYGDIKALADKLAAALKKVPDYDVGAPADINIAGFTAIAQQLDGLNQLTAGKEQTLATARAIRKDSFDGEKGLKVKMIAIKEAIKSQYGTQSAAYLQAKVIRV